MILCVDGGGTKSHVLLAEDSGMILAEGFGGPMVFSAVPFEQAYHNLQSAIMEASSKIKQQLINFDKAVIGLAGMDSPLEIARAKDLYTTALRRQIKGEIILVNDMVIALLAGSNNDNAVVLNAGTGSACFGFNNQGQKAKAGGLDYLLSDEGSAFYLGQEALRAAIRSFDGRGKKSKLEDLVREYFAVDDITDIKTKIYGEAFQKTNIARLSSLVSTAAMAGDEIAQQILQTTMKELALAVKAVVARLGIGRSDFDLVLVGGLFVGNTIHPATFASIIQNMFPQANIIPSQDPPVYGALKLALSRAKQDN